MNDYALLANVRIGRNVQIGRYCIVGFPPVGYAEGDLETVIGDEALLRTHTVIYAGVVIGEAFQSGHGVLIREFTHVGRGVSIGSGSVVEHHVEIGNEVRVHSQAFIPEYTVLEDGCWIGPRVVLTNVPYPLSRRAKEYLRANRICRGAKVGANATVLPGVVVGEGSLVGAGAVVTRNVPPETVVIGNPAKIIKKVSDLRYDEDPSVLPY